MTSIPALHVRLEGLTSSFRHPLTISGTQVSTPMPSYSNLLGTISACAGRIVKPEETRIGFEFRCQSHDLELERTVRWKIEKGRLKPHPKGQGISKRQVYWYPKLDLYLTNLGLKSAFENPAATPCFGRSQDIAWIVFVREIELYPRTKGALGATLIPMPQPGVAGLIVRLPEWMDNTRRGYTREPGPFGIYQAMIPTTELRFEVERENLYHPSDSEAHYFAIYLHKWIKE
ncbi:MAG: CRISPR-associated protein Cas5 [Deltaproteobacteria bacterium]|nr:CRISPR-associated protein Cas5 [Deltaproteobacteria bacterium]